MTTSKICDYCSEWTNSKLDPEVLKCTPPDEFFCSITCLIAHCVDLQIHLTGD